MQVNMTLFLQVLNFWIAYWFLNKFMFKPVLVFLEQKKHRENLIKKNIYEKEDLLLQMEQRKKEELGNFKHNMSLKFEHKASGLENTISEISDKKINKNEAEKIIQVATELLVERVPHVD